jgi:hypothetical protein
MVEIECNCDYCENNKWEDCELKSKYEEILNSIKNKNLNKDFYLECIRYKYRDN